MQQIVFWQNIISPHQINFLNAISKSFKIILVVDCSIDDYRKNDGWNIPDHSFMNVHIQPNNDIINLLFKNNETIHVFSGIGAYKYVHRGFKKALKEKARIGIFSEPVEMKGVSGILKYVRGNYQRLIYGNKIDFICATGKLGVQTYLNFGYKSKKIFNWGYFVDSLNTKVQDRKNTLVFVGQLVKRKQIIKLLNLLIINNFFGFDSFKIVGQGKYKNKIEEILRINNVSSKVSVLGRLSQNETYKIISESKLLIIPSEFDGWGVVVNEALLCGTPVIASSNVGANILIDGDKRGDVFQIDKFNDLKKILPLWSKKTITPDDNLKIKNWAESRISTQSAARYLNNILEFIYFQRKEKPIVPWKK